MIPHSQPTIETDDIAAVTRVMLSAQLAQGREVRAFEEETAAWLGLRGGVATSSGTAALHLALLALGIGPGAEVLIPSYSCVAVYHAVCLAGGAPRIVDCEPNGVNMWLEAAARQAGRHTRAVILPHMFGVMASVETFRTLGVPIIENCAHALGGRAGGSPAGSFGDLTVLSFYATKMITTGEGGMLLSRNEGLLAEARDLREYDNRPNHRLRFNYKMTDVQAALGRSQLRKLSRFVNRRHAIARTYYASLQGTAPTYTIPEADGTAYRYVVSVPNVEELIREAFMHGVECKRPVYRPLHELTGEACPNASRLFQDAVSLPLYPSLSDAEVASIGTLTAQIVDSQRRRKAATRS